MLTARPLALVGRRTAAAVALAALLSCTAPDKADEPARGAVPPITATEGLLIEAEPGQPVQIVFTVRLEHVLPEGAGASSGGLPGWLAWAIGILAALGVAVIVAVVLLWRSGRATVAELRALTRVESPPTHHPV